MKKLSFLFLFLTTILTAQTDIYFTSKPSLSPDGSKIVFSFDGDLWTVSNNGGQSLRITAMQGDETDALYSPDGKLIAFTGSEDGNQNVYVMPVGGGEIKQLTYYDRNDAVSSWSWDSKFIYFTSNRYNRMSTYKVSIYGGT
ncbi:MAG: peptidase S41, partial [Ignavibacteriales bacterium CG_4_9_14_3_um_filter_30_11]